jgi:hypothetical protein
MAITNLTGAIGDYRATAAKLFNDAHRIIAGPPEPTEEVKKQKQGELAAAFSQLSTAETMSSAQTGRDGYAQVVKLMTTTATAADAICVKLTALTSSVDPTMTQLQEQLQAIGALSNALQALAQISPAAVWQKGSTPGGAAG